MKVLILSTHDDFGGAERCAFRLHKGLNRIGINSFMLVAHKHSDLHNVYLGNRGKLQRSISLVIPKLEKLYTNCYTYSTTKKPNVQFSPSLFSTCFTFEEYVNSINPDIIHVHYLSHSFLSLKRLVSLKIPIVWTMHDMWIFTGGCHYDQECGRYVQSCGKCKILNSNKVKDLSSKVYERKNNILKKIQNISFIASSNWMKDSALSSSLLSSRNVSRIQTGVDTTVFRPAGKFTARDAFNLPQRKKIILFGAMNSTSDPRKGFKYLKEAIYQIRDKDIEIVIFGASHGDEIDALPFPVHFLGRLTNDNAISLAYSCADVMMVPSIQENLANTIMESLSCGTPVVAFKLGGNPDMIEHKVNGYLSDPFDANDLANGIDWVINKSDWNTMSRNARSKAVKYYEITDVAKLHKNYYENLLQKDN